MKKKLTDSFTREMIRPLIYKVFTRFILMLLVILLWNNYLQPLTPHLTLSSVFPVAGFLFLLFAFLIYLRMDGISIPRMKPLKKPKRDPFRSYGDMEDFLDTPPVMFDDLTKEEQDVCSFCANIICAVLFFAAAALPL